MVFHLFGDGKDSVGKLILPLKLGKFLLDVLLALLQLFFLGLCKFSIS